MTDIRTVASPPALRTSWLTRLIQAGAGFSLAYQMFVAWTASLWVAQRSAAIGGQLDLVRGLVGFGIVTFLAIAFLLLIDAGRRGIAPKEPLAAALVVLFLAACVELALLALGVSTYYRINDPQFGRPPTILTFLFIGVFGLVWTLVVEIRRFLEWPQG